VLAGQTGSDIKAQLHQERRRLLIFIHILALAIYAVSLYRVTSLAAHGGMMMLESALFLLVIVNLYFLIRRDNLSVSALILMTLISLAGLIGIAGVIDEPIVSKQLYWAVAIAPAAFYLTGRRGGSLVSGALIVALWGIYGYFSGTRALTNETMLDFSGVYLAIAVISYLYARTQSLNIRRMLHYSQDLAFANDELKVAALTDTLTCSYNRKFLDELLSELTAHQQRAQFSLIMMDIDHFKQVNDDHGHQVGDDILSAVTRGLQSQLRDQDILGRWGGEEFIIISQGLGADKALNLAERLRSFIEGAEFPHGLRITCSFGVVECREHENKAELIKRADNALYEAKKSGRNRSVLAQPTAA
jgi:diguanylate cyclase (GGDEF)-like protein